MARSLRLDRVDADLDQVLPVPLGPAELLGTLLLEHDDFPGPHRPEDGRRHRDALRTRRLVPASGEDDLRELQCLALLGPGRGLLDPDDVAGRNLQLLSARTEDRVHGASRDRTAN